MFDIEYKGGNTVVISTKTSNLVVDPKLSVYGKKDIIVKDAVELATEDKFLTNNPEFKLSIGYPGSYEVSGFAINGFAERLSTESDKNILKGVVYSVSISGVRIGILGNIDSKISDDQLENLGILDIIILPVGGGNTINATATATIARRSDAKVIIPICYDDVELKYDVPQSELSLFLKEIGLESEKVSKYKVKSPAALPEKITVIELTRSK